MDTDQGKTEDLAYQVIRAGRERGKETRPASGGLKESHIQKGFTRLGTGDSTGTKTDHKQADGSARKNRAVSGRLMGDVRMLFYRRWSGTVSQEATFQR